MATTVDARAIAGALYESLVGKALEQLRAAAPKLTGPVGTGDPAQRIDAALPADALPQVRNFLLGLAREGLLDQAAEVAEAFAGFAAAGAVALDASVTSAMPLTEAQQATITGDLRSRYGADLKVSFGVDQSLIGGLIIRVGDQVLDNSLRTRLSAVQRNMLAS